MGARGMFDKVKHPHGFHGHWAPTANHELAKAKRHGEIDHDVLRGPQGEVLSAPRGQLQVVQLKATARRLAGMEDRVDERLRWGEQTKGHWYMVKGSRYWVKQDSKPGWHNGFYYKPGQTWPVVPPSDTWESRDSYHGIPGQTPMSSVVPDDVRTAAQMYKEDRTGKRDVRHGADRTAKSEAFERRKSRAGHGTGSDGVRQSKRYRARTVKPTARDLMSASGRYGT
jgi:hypothetical protein